MALGRLYLASPLSARGIDSILTLVVRGKLAASLIPQVLIAKGAHSALTDITLFFFFCLLPITSNFPRLDSACGHFLA